MVNIVSHWIVDSVGYFKVESRKLHLFWIMACGQRRLF